MTDTDFIYGTFIQETKNRFLCTVSIDSEQVECYIPSSCRLSNFLDLKGRTVLLVPNQNKAARTRFAVYAVKVGRQYILLNLAKPNRVIEAELVSKRFSFLGKRSIIHHEKTIEGYKSDLYIEDTKTIVEIKSILSFDFTAVFPTVYSERAIKQLDIIAELLDKGYRVFYMFASLNPGVKGVRLNHAIKEYTQAFQVCLNKGMTCYGFAVKLKKGMAAFEKRIPVILDEHSYISEKP